MCWVSLIFLAGSGKVGLENAFKINDFRSTQPTILWDLYRSTERLAKAIEVLLTIHSLDPRWGF